MVVLPVVIAVRLTTTTVVPIDPRAFKMTPRLEYIGSIVTILPMNI